MKKDYENKKKKGRAGKAVISIIAVLMAAVLCVSAVGHFTGAKWWPLQTEDAKAGEENAALLKELDELRGGFEALQADYNQLYADYDALVNPPVVVPDPPSYTGPFLILNAPEDTIAAVSNVKSPASYAYAEWIAGAISNAQLDLDSRQYADKTDAQLSCPSVYPGITFYFRIDIDFKSAGNYILQFEVDGFEATDGMSTVDLAKWVQFGTMRLGPVSSSSIWQTSKAMTDYVNQSNPDKRKLRQNFPYLELLGASPLYKEKIIYTLTLYPNIWGKYPNAFNQCFKMEKIRMNFYTEDTFCEEEPE